MADQTQNNQQNPSQDATQTPQPFFERIKQARTMGYQDNAILSSIIKANPQMATKIQQASSQGVSPSVILKQISLQSAKNYGQAAHDEGVKAQGILSNPLLQFGQIMPFGNQIKGGIEGLTNLGEKGTEVAQGAVQGLASTSENIYNVGQKLSGLNPITAAGKATGIIPEQKPLELPAKMTKSTTPLQKAGFATEQIGEFFVPAGIEEKAAVYLDELSKASQLNKFFNVAGKIATSAATTGTVAGVQTGSAEEAQKGALIGAAITGVSGVAGKALDAVSKWKGLASFMSKATSYADDAIKKAFERTSGAVKGATEGQGALNDIVVKANDKIFSMAGAAKKAAISVVNKMEKGLTAVYKESSRYGEKATFDYLRDEGNNFLRKVGTTLNKTYNIGVDSEGKLLFDRSKYPSNIVSGAEKGAIQDAFDTLQKAYATPTIKNINAVFERLISLQTKTPAGAVTGPETKKIVSGMIDEVLGFSKSLGKVDERYAQYAEFADKNVTERVFWEKAKEIFGATPHIESDPVELDKVSRKLVGLYQDMNLATRQETEKIGAKIKEDILGTAAGTAIKEDVSKFGTPPTSARGLITKIAEAIPRQIVQNYIKTGKITGEGVPVLNFAAKMAGMTVEALIKELSLDKSKD